MGTFTQSGAAEILRSNQKDESFLHYLKTSIADIVLNTAGTRTWLNFHKTIETGCELVYYGLTTLSLRQTLGEEYTGLLQVDSSLKHLPSSIRRALMVILHCLGPWYINYLFKKLEESLISGYLSSYLRPEISSFCLKHLKVLKFTINLINKVHLATFYLRGHYYHLSKRLTGINYVLVRDWLGDDTSKKSFRTLGFLILTQLVLSSILSGYRLWSKDYQQSNNSTTSNCYVSPNDQCPLCLGERQDSSVTPCGHLFCWTCIHSSLKSSSVCPICRHAALPSQIVPLINFDKDER